MQSIRDQLLTYAIIERDKLVEGANNGVDDDLPPEERPNRAEAMPGCRLKFSDEVEAYGTTVMYLCPGRGLTWFYGLSFEGALLNIGQYEITVITDRIPADPNEAPMPIFEEPSPEEPPPENP